MELSGIQQFLEQYRQRLFAAEDERKTITEIFGAYGIIIMEKNISIKNTILTITADSVTKNEIFLNKSPILDQINERIAKQISDIH